MRGISLVLPCLNEAKTLPKVLKDATDALLRCSMPSEIIVADNGSDDGSPEIAAQGGAKVVNVSVKGYGVTLNAGILEARFDFIVFADADGTYPMESIPEMVELLSQVKGRLVLGSRFKGEIEPHAMPFLNRYLGTPVLTWILRRLYHLPASDCNSGMRAITAETYSLLDMRCSGMEYSSEMLVKAALHRLDYAEIPISYRPGSRPSHMKRWRDGCRHLYFLLFRRTLS